MSHALYIACLEEMGDLDEARPSFRTQVLDIPTKDQLMKLPIHIAAPFVTIWKALTQLEPEAKEEDGGAPLPKSKRVLVYTVMAGVTFYFALVLLILSPMEQNLRMIAAAFYLAFATVVAYTRYATRTQLGIQTGDLMTDTRRPAPESPFWRDKTRLG